MHFLTHLFYFEKKIPSLKHRWGSVDHLDLIFFKTKTSTQWMIKKPASIHFFCKIKKKESLRVFQPLVEFRETHVRTKLLKENFNKNPAGRCRRLLTHLDALQHLVKNKIRRFKLSYLRMELMLLCLCSYTPRYRVCVKQVSKEPSHIPQLVGLQTVNCLVLFCKYRLKTLHVLLFQETKPLRKQQSHLQDTEVFV